MNRFIPLDKKSKKAQKKFYALQRNTWNGLNPVTRTVPNGKGYDRNKLKREDRRNSRTFRNENPAVLYFSEVHRSVDPSSKPSLLKEV